MVSLMCPTRAQEAYNEAIDVVLGPQTVRCVAVLFYQLWEEWSEASVQGVILEAFAHAIEEERMRIIQGLEARGISGAICLSVTEQALMEMAAEECRLHLERGRDEVEAATNLQRGCRRALQMKAYFKLRQAAIWAALKGERTEIQMCEKVIAYTVDAECEVIVAEAYAEAVRVVATEAAMEVIGGCLEECQQVIRKDAKLVCRWVERPACMHHKGQRMREGGAARPVGG